MFKLLHELYTRLRKLPTSKTSVPPATAEQQALMEFQEKLHKRVFENLCTQIGPLSNLRSMEGVHFVRIGGSSPPTPSPELARQDITPVSNPQPAPSKFDYLTPIGSLDALSKSVMLRVQLNHGLELLREYLRISKTTAIHTSVDPSTVELFDELLTQLSIAADHLQAAIRTNIDRVPIQQHDILTRLNEEMVGRIPIHSHALDIPLNVRRHAQGVFSNYTLMQMIHPISGIVQYCYKISALLTHPETETL